MTSSADKTPTTTTAYCNKCGQPNRSPNGFCSYCVIQQIETKTEPWRAALKEANFKVGDMIEIRFKPDAPWKLYHIDDMDDEYVWHGRQEEEGTGWRMRWLYTNLWRKPAGTVDKEETDTKSKKKRPASDDESPATDDIVKPPPPKRQKTTDLHVLTADELEAESKRSGDECGELTLKTAQLETKYEMASHHRACVHREQLVRDIIKDGKEHPNQYILVNVNRFTDEQKARLDKVFGGHVPSKGYFSLTTARRYPPRYDDSAVEWVLDTESNDDQINDSGYVPVLLPSTTLDDGTINDEHIKFDGDEPVPEKELKPSSKDTEHWEWDHKSGGRASAKLYYETRWYTLNPAVTNKVRTLL